MCPAFPRKHVLIGRMSEEEKGADVLGFITVFDAILMGRQSGQKLQCLYGNPIANNFFQN